MVEEFTFEQGVRMAPRSTVIKLPGNGATAGGSPGRRAPCPCHSLRGSTHWRRFWPLIDQGKYLLDGNFIADDLTKLLVDVAAETYAAFVPVSSPGGATG